METKVAIDILGIDESSYRTYEEWKLHPMTLRWKIFERSYRTYEEWKLRSRKTVSLSAMGSYRTYEEWKHITTK